MSIQILSQFWMFVPSPDKLPEAQWEAWLFVIHLCIGMLALCFVAVRLISILEDEQDGKRLYPWTNKKSLSSLWAEVKAISSGMKQGSVSLNLNSCIASAVHGLGLILVLGLGTTGVLFYLGLSPGGAMGEITAFFRSSHEYLAILLWIFLFGHIGMFIRHRVRGELQSKEIFTFDEDK